MAGTVVAAFLIAPLVIPGYMLGSWRWLRRTRSYYEVIVVLAVFLFAWYAVLLVLGGSEALVPVAMLTLVGGFGWGRISYGRQRRPSSE